MRTNRKGGFLLESKKAYLEYVYRAFFMIFFCVHDWFATSAWDYRVVKISFAAQSYARRLVAERQTDQAYLIAVGLWWWERALGSRADALTRRGTA